MEKDEDVMEKELKICLPLYKIGYAVFFVMILSFVRGVTYAYEIGIALETPMALLAAVFCGDAYVQEITSKRSEIQRLCPINKRAAAVGKRMVIQILFLQLLSMAGYGMFHLFQRPRAVYELPPLERDFWENGICFPIRFGILRTGEILTGCAGSFFVLV